MKLRCSDCAKPLSRLASFWDLRGILVKCCGCDVRLFAVHAEVTQVIAGIADGFALCALNVLRDHIIASKCDPLGKTLRAARLFSAPMLPGIPSTHVKHRDIWVSIGLLLALVFAVFVTMGRAEAATYTGTVFEDVNYGGGAGRSRTASSGVPLANVRVELYRQSNGNFVTSGVTNASGVYSLSSGNTSNAMIVRVVNGTVRSSRSGGCATCVPVQTFRTMMTSGNVVNVTDRVGGETPTLSDAASNTGSNNISTLNSASQAAQSIAAMTPPSNLATISGIDFGFNFDTIVNTRDPASCTASGTNNTFYPCQGSLRQFIINANALASAAFLAQFGSGQLDGSTTSLPSGYESTIFMIPNGVANPGQSTSYANQLTGGVAVITLNAALPTITTSNVRLDATTQTINVGNTNTGTLGSGGTVGVDAVTLPLFQRPEVQLSAGNTQVVLNGTNNNIVGFALRQGYILLSGTSGTARNNLVGMTATGVSTDNSPTFYGIIFSGANAIVRNNFVTVNNSGIRTDNGGIGAQITSNEVARPSAGHSTTFDGILMVGNVSNIQVVGNLTRDQLGGGIEIGFGGGAPATNITVNNNTVQNNGFTSGTTASTEPVGFVGYAYVGTNVVVSRNRFISNAGAGVLVTAASGTLITQNSYSNNVGLSIDLDTRGLDPNTMGPPGGVSINDNGDVDTQPNSLLNYAVITSATLIGTELTLTGFARPNSSIELYLAQADPTNFGEGQTYLGTLIEGSVADLSGTTGTYGPANINGLSQGTDTTNRFSFRIVAPGGVAIGSHLSSTATVNGETSEFGGNVIVTGGPSLTHLKTVQVLSDPANGTTNPKSIPGSTQVYTLRVTNQGSGALDNNSVAIVDAIPATTRLFVGNLGLPGSGPVAFTNGSPTSGLTWTFTSLASATDDIQFSNDGGVTWTYTPTADANGCDGAVTHIRMSPKGTMPGNGGGNPYFELRFRVVVK